MSSSTRGVRQTQACAPESAVVIQRSDTACGSLGLDSPGILCYQSTAHRHPPSESIRNSNVRQVVLTLPKDPLK